MKTLVLVFAVLALASTVAFAQAEARAGQFGIQTSVVFTATNLSPGGSLGAKYMISNNMAIRAALGFENTSNLGTGYDIGAGFEYHFGGKGGVTPYVGGEFSYSSGTLSSGATADSVFGLNGIFGAEYFFSSNFSWAGELSLGFFSASAAGTTVTTIGTGQALFILTWYIN